MLYFIASFLTLVGLSCAGSWHTGPDGNIALEGTPQYEANAYVKKIFRKYGVDLSARDEIGERELGKLMLNLGLGIIHKIPKPGKEEDHDDHERRRRSIADDHPTDEEGGKVVAFADSVSSVPHFHENVSSMYANATNCRSAPLLLQEYNMQSSVTATAGIGAYEFGWICPALVYLMDEETCIKLQSETVEARPPALSVWGFGFVSITVISLLSFLGVAIVPLISASFFQSLLSVLVAGAVGALTGDALLHLIPHSQSSHSHDKEPVYKNLTVLLGIYFLFVVEGLMKLSHHKKDRNKMKKAKLNGEQKVPSKVSIDSTVKIDDENDILHPEERDHDHGRHAHEHTHDHGTVEGKGIASVAWMVIAGDGMHNFSDGVAIGAAFSASLVGGMSTSIAVFCHELPHELGDFAMLVKAGMTVKQALFYNGFAACLGYVGLVLGILIGNYAASVTPWIFAVTAGMFLYVALVDMLPEMNSGMHQLKTKSATSTFILQNVGLLVGIGIMVIISLFEENIDFGS